LFKDVNGGVFLLSPLFKTKHDFMHPTPMSKRIYLDNAATTRIDDEVVQAMLPYLQDNYGNPSSTYSYGREARLAVERARKEVAQLLGAPKESIVFTSGGTESNNMAILAAVRDLACHHIVYTPTEHHSVLHAVEHYAQDGVTMSPLKLVGEGMVDMDDLEWQLRNLSVAGERCLVCIMHANNETEVMADLAAIGRLCRHYGAIFLADCVATIGHLPLSFGELPVDLATAAAHKFHGPKGAGLLYIRPGLPIGALLHGGGQERNQRAGTENVAGIIGLATALRIFYRDYDKDSPAIRHLRLHTWLELHSRIPDIQLNGDLGEGLYTLLNVSLPKTARTEGILNFLDELGICLSGGSACLAGAASHVLAALGRDNGVPLRFSFSKYNTLDEVNVVVGLLEGLAAGKVVGATFT
jgi:cysteine desulfurase